jgi:hypothetical protein
VFELCAVETNGDRRGFRALKGGLRFDERDFVSHACVVLRLCVVDGFLIGGDGVVEEFLQRVLAANLKYELS